MKTFKVYNDKSMGRLSSGLKDFFGLRCTIEQVEDSIELHIERYSGEGNLISKEKKGLVSIKSLDLEPSTYLLDEENSDEDVLYFDKIKI